MRAGLPCITSKLKQNHFGLSGEIKIKKAKCFISKILAIN